MATFSQHAEFCDEGIKDLLKYDLNSATRTSKSPFGMQKFSFQVSFGKWPCHIFLQKTSLPQICQALIFIIFPSFSLEQWWFCFRKK